MKKILILAAITFFFSCGNKDGYSIEGSIDESFNGKQIIVSHIEANNATRKIDSTVVENGKFTLDLPEIDRVHLAFLNIEGLRMNLPYIAENEVVSFTIRKDSLRQSAIKGGPQNKVFNEYITHLVEINKLMSEKQNEARMAVSANDSATLVTLTKERDEILENDKLYKMKVAKEHPDALTAIMVLTDLTNVKSVSSIEIKNLFEGLSEEVRTSTLGVNLKQMLDAKSATDIGAKAPEFTAPTHDGQTLSLKDALGKVTILDFWASWCKPCRIENPNVVRVYNKYHDKGLNIVGISLDKASQKDRWLKAIEDDGLTWQHVSHLQFWQEPIAQDYNVRAIPATFILDENGVIIAKNLRGQELEDKMAELLN